MDVFVSGFGHVVAFVVLLEIFEGSLPRKGLGIVVFRSREHVADGLGRINPGHGHDDDSAAEEIGPVFPMVLVAFGVMLANAAEIAVLKPFFIHG